MTRLSIIKLIIFCTAFLMCAPFPEVDAADIATIKKQIKARLPKIDSMKKEGLVGVSNRAYLVARGSLSEEQRKLMAAENKDRAALYSLIANSAGASVAEVEKGRARQIAQRSGSGIWLQDGSGNWYKK